MDEMKCYLMGPHRIGVARPRYWQRESLAKHRVLMLATGRNHMACIAVADPELPSGPPLSGAVDLAEEASVLPEDPAGMEPGASERITECFRAVDVENSGTIGVLEFEKLLTSLGFEHRDEETDALFAAADANNDGQVDYEEFVSWLFDQ